MPSVSAADAETSTTRPRTNGPRSLIRQPLGYAIVGGLAVSQILTLYTTPVVYLYLDRLQIWLFGEKKHAAAGHAQPTPAE